jgi:hypothetical protein
MGLKEWTYIHKTYQRWVNLNLSKVTYQSSFDLKTKLNAAAGQVIFRLNALR